MLTLLTVLSVWTGLALLTATGLCAVFAGARRLEATHAPAPASLGRPHPVPVRLPLARTSEDAAVSA